MRYDERKLQFWTRPLSKTEKLRVDNAINMVRKALAECEELQEFAIDVFAQGSYANNTNVRQESDVDLCVMLREPFFCEFANGKSARDYGYVSATRLSFPEYKAYVLSALYQKFGREQVTGKNKSINISSNSYRVNADVVPCWQYKNYRFNNSIDPDEYVEGIMYFAKEDGSCVVNYPKRHIQNGIDKNKNTNHYYKGLVRIMKHIRNDMVQEYRADGEKITSFLIECLVWNIPDEVITGYETWEETIQEANDYLMRYLDWGIAEGCHEVNGILPLFREGRKWTIPETREFLRQMKIYINE